LILCIETWFVCKFITFLIGGLSDQLNFTGIRGGQSDHILEMKGRVRNSLKRTTKRTNEREKGQKEA